MGNLCSSKPDIETRVFVPVSPLVTLPPPYEFLTPVMYETYLFGGSSPIAITNERSSSASQNHLTRSWDDD